MLIMKIQERFKVLFRKYIQNDYTSAELKEFFDLFKELPDDAEVFGDDYILEEIKKVHSEKLLEDKAQEIFKRIDSKKKSSIRKLDFHSLYKMTAVFIGLVICGGIIWYFNYDQVLLNAESDNKYVVIENAHGEQEYLIDEEEKIIVSEVGDTIGVRNKNTIRYTKENKRLVYNTLHVPNGKRIELSLADGSHIYLNSGSSIRYPLNFKLSNNRLIQLKGEAYFEVAKDSTRPFIVNSRGFNVQVLGTAFNFNSYEENESIDVVLTEGLVAMYDDEKDFSGDSTQLLKPGNKASYTRLKGLEKTRVDTGLYTSWRFGNLIFRNSTLEQIFTKLERNFDVEIIINNSRLSGEVLNANFGDESIEDIILYLNGIYDFKYKINGDLIIIE